MPEVFTIPPASAKPLWVVAAIGALLLSMVLFFAYVAYASRATQYEISGDGLSIRRTPYGRTIPWSRLDVAQARVVDLEAASDLRPTLRTNGIGLPGYRAGWFRLGQGGRGLLFVTDPSRVVALPTRDGFTVLLSVQDPAAFLGAVRRAAGG